MKRYIVIILALFTVFACQEQGIDTYSDGRYLTFSTLDTAEKISFVDSVATSFSYYPDAEKIEMKFELNLIGLPSDNDLTYHISVVDSLTTAKGVNFDIPTEHIFKGGLLKDSLKINLVKSDDLKDNVQVVFAIVPGGDLKGGMPGRNILKVKFNNTLSKPLWWSKTVEKAYLGVYSNEKYTEFMRYTGVVDFGKLNATLKRMNALKFKEAIIKYNLKEADGSVMVVTVY